MTKNDDRQAHEMDYMLFVNVHLEAFELKRWLSVLGDIRVVSGVFPRAG